MSFIWKKMRAIIRWTVVAFLGSTILAVVALRFLPVYFTPLMFIRCYEQMTEGKSLKMKHHWVPLNKISPSLPMAVMASEDAKFLKSQGVSSSQIKTIDGQGSKNPVSDNSTAEGRKQNRRVEVYMYASEQMIKDANAEAAKK